MCDIEFTILNSKNEPVIIKCETNSFDNYLYRGGLVIKCNCQTEEDELNNYIYEDDKVYCPICGKEALNVKVNNEELTDLHLEYIGQDMITMQRLFRLSHTISYNLWQEVSKYFFKLSPAEVDLEYPIDFIKWVTVVPEFVEVALNIKPELLIRNRDIETELLTLVDRSELIEGEDKSAEQFDIVDKLHELFSVVETPAGEFSLDAGEIIANPLFPPNKYGTGEFWYIIKNKKEIWYVRYNFREGDDLRFNNILIDGDLKAIGKVIYYDEAVSELIHELKG